MSACSGDATSTSTGTVLREHGTCGHLIAPLPAVVAEVATLPSDSPLAWPPRVQAVLCKVLRTRRISRRDLVVEVLGLPRRAADGFGTKGAANTV